MQQQKDSFEQVITQLQKLSNRQYFPKLNIWVVYLILFLSSFGGTVAYRYFLQFQPTHQVWWLENTNRQ